MTSIPTHLGDPLDYSRFDGIGSDSDSDTEGAAETTKKAVPTTCANCGAEGAKLRCSRCKKVVYCNAKCQRSDWRFHKRICQKPKKKPTKEERELEKRRRAAARGETVDPPASSSSSSSTTTSSSKSASKSSSSSSSKLVEEPRKPVKDDSAEELHMDEEDLEALKGLRGYRYFGDVSEASLAGEFTPKKVDASEAAPAPAPAPAPVAVAGGGAGGAAGGISSSEWNSAGTFEEVDKTEWAKQRIVELLSGLTSGCVRVKAVKDVNGEADVAVVRGSKRYIFDFNFVVKFEAKPADTKIKGSLKFLDFEHDGGVSDTPTELSWDAKNKDVPREDELTVRADVKQLKEDCLEALTVFMKEFHSL
eukprot:PLAT4548.1.p1 GENE.PLAT4548.1~~PLAT4548.1.p1  ORF type:complete len:363 (+),score=156.79 PLAT4548.1:11-1099(+)